MDAGIDNQGIGFGYFVQGQAGITRHDFYDGSEGMFFIAWVDAFGGVAEAEVAAVEPEVGGLFQDGKAVFFRAAGRGGGFIYDEVAFFQDFSYGAGGSEEGF